MYELKSYCRQGVEIAQSRAAGALSFVVRRLKGFGFVDWMVLQLTALVTGLLWGAIGKRVVKKFAFLLVLASGFGIAYLILRIFFFDNPVKRIRKYVDLL